MDKFFFKESQNLDKTSLIIDLCQQEGFQIFAIASAQKYLEQQMLYENWLASNYHGGMKYLEKHILAKYNPQEILPGCNSILSIALGYYQSCNNSINLTKTSGRISCYAWGRDYHKVIGNKLLKMSKILQKEFPTQKFLPSVDATPLDERWFAWKAGLGFFGYNTLLIIPPLGSYFFLGEILSTQKFPDFISEHVIQDHQKHQKFCESCQKCLSACPTHALIRPYIKDSRRCISYLTIEHRDSIPESIRPKINNWLIGCDICQSVCPYNQNCPTTTEPDFLQHRSNPSQDLAEIFALSNDLDFQKKYAGTPIMRAKRQGLIRNACIVAGNSRTKELIPNLRYLAHSNIPILSEHATWAIQKLSEF